MWHSSSIFITWSDFLWFTINLLAHLSNSIDAYWERVLAFQASRVSYLTLGSLCLMCGMAYAFARVYLVVEAFVSMRQMPLTAYTTPNWAQIIPHL
jgi:predicted transporter